MTNYEKLRRKPLLFRMFTGLSADEFDKVVADLEPVWLVR
ncbi:MAG: IS5/IS1182 family transposase, partial [Planctomycetes bacterium]|nr:IS5/IS1182 family transposase [Planctomycetota bacterium]